MASFDFSTLNSTDLEELVRDILNAKEKANKTGIEYKTFKEGKDQGIDFAYSTSKNKYEIIGQVKHYYRSGYSALLALLKKEEVSKVKKLNPQRYIIATSVDLSFLNTEEIKNIFNPFIKSLYDIYGKNDLNKYIDEYPEVLQNNFKLWFSSSNVLRKIINYSIEGRSNEFSEQGIKKRLRLYVEIPLLKEAKRLIDKNKILIITGEPGIGKTSLAELLLYDCIKNDFELTYIYDDIKEVEKIISNDNKKQIFYFDDFLGHNFLEISKSKGSETALLKILRRVAESENKLFILTTRTFILNAAIEESENLRRFNIKAKASTIKISEYSIELKKQLTQNHIEESSLRDELKEVILKRLDYIVYNPNFSPRSIEFITFSEQVNQFSVDEFDQFITNNYNKPDEIWRHAYEQQIDDYDRLFLNTFITFGDSVKFHEIENAFNSRLEYEVKNNNFQRPLNAFLKTFRKLLGGFILPEHSYEEFPDFFEEVGKPYKLINHSLTDFLISYISQDKREIHRIIESVYYISQLTKRIIPLGIEDKYIPSDLESRLINEYKFFIKEETEYSDRLTIALLLNNYTDISKSKHIIIENLNNIKNWDFLTEDYSLKDHFLKYIETVEDHNMIEQLINLISLYVTPILLSTENYSKIKKIISLIHNKLKITPDELFKNISIEKITDHFSSLIQENFNEEIEWLVYHADNIDFPDEKIREFMSLRDELRTYGLNIDVDFSEYNSYDWWEIVSENYFREQMEKDD